MPSVFTEDEITLTLFQPMFADSESTIASFDQAMNVLQRGATGRQGEMKVSVRSRVTPAEGVGGKASYINEMSQLSGVHGQRIYDITVNAGCKPSLEEDLAPSLAQAIG